MFWGTGPRTAALSILALLCGLPALASAQGIESARRAASRDVEGSVHMANQAVSSKARLHVVGAHRPVDAPSITPAPAAQAGLDLYLAGGSIGALEIGQHFDVFRQIPTPLGSRTELIIKVGALRIISVHQGLAVARVTDGPARSDQPLIGTPGVIIGDHIRADRPTTTPAEADPEALAGKPVTIKRSKPGQKPTRAGAPTASKSRPRANKKPAGQANAKPKPGDRDPDSFHHWEDPIDF